MVGYFLFFLLCIALAVLASSTKPTHTCSRGNRSRSGEEMPVY